ncbi:MAG: hypothetical protein KGL39_34540 [Patescibacteria group bacterium]|nr:hypothetical protein [Patescibacteria group bacterium]
MSLTKEQVDKMLDDAATVERCCTVHTGVPIEMVRDLCCHVKALASDHERRLSLDELHVPFGGSRRIALAQAFQQAVDYFTIGSDEYDTRYAKQSCWIEAIETDLEIDATAGSAFKADAGREYLANAPEGEAS